MKLGNNQRGERVLILAGADWASTVLIGLRSLFGSASQPTCNSELFSAVTAAVNDRHTPQASPAALASGLNGVPPEIRGQTRFGSPVPFLLSTGRRYEV